MLTWEEVMEAEDTECRREYGRMCSGISVFRQGRALILHLPNAGFRVLSSGFTNGGFMDSPQAVVNITGMGGRLEGLCMADGLNTYDDVNRAYASKLALDPERTVFQGTAASMDNAALVDRESPDGIKVSFAVTAGIKHNGGRAGDPASYDEYEALFKTPMGTIITLAAIDAYLSDSAMVQAMLLVTEVKSCVIQELQARSLYSPGIATGSGTDQVTIIINKDSPNRIGDLERDSDLAKTMAQAMRAALLEAFDRQSGMNPETQWDPLVLLSRYKLDGIREEIRFPATMEELLSALEYLRKDSYTAAMVSALLNIADDTRNGLVTLEEGMIAARRICRKSILDEITDPVENLRLDNTESMEELISLVAAMKLMQTVVKRRSGDGQ